MDYLADRLNRGSPAVMFVDINSCFATIEQQANPLLRGRGVAVGAYTTPSGCILAASVEAKRLGVKTGMRVGDGRRLCPDLVILPPDPDKYRAVHLSLKKILADYTDNLEAKSIDEFVLNLEGCPTLKEGMIKVAQEIKKRIREEVGEWIRVSIGIGASRFWAKTASNLIKPDGLVVIDGENILEVYGGLKLEDLYGINSRNAARLNGVGIFTVREFFDADVSLLKAAFRSVCAYDWYWRLRGWEVDEVEFERRSFGQSYVLPKPLLNEEELLPILAKLTEKMSRRMRQNGYETQGIHLGLLYSDGSYWHRGRKLKEAICITGEIYRQLRRLLVENGKRPVSKLEVACIHLRRKRTSQLVLFGDAFKKEGLAQAQDEINDVWGDYTIGMSRMMKLGKTVVGDRIAFGL